MTEKYRSELFSRIKKLNFTNAVFINRAFRLFAVFFAFFIAGLIIYLIIPPPDRTDASVYGFFCTSFKEMSAFEGIERITSFSAADFWTVLLIGISGYTMLASKASFLILALSGIRGGYCISYLYKLLISSDMISGGGATFAYTVICKGCILATLIFLSVSANDFSYRYSELYRRLPKPILSAESLNYMIITVSTAGVSALINTLYMVFQLISPSAMC